MSDFDHSALLCVPDEAGMRAGSVAFAAIVFVLSTYPTLADPTFALIDQVGQANFKSCQSYALAIALAFKRDVNFPVTTWSGLRKTELAIRTAIEAARHARNPADEVSHEDIKTGFESYTGGAHKLRQASTDITGLGEKIAEVTGVSVANIVPPSFLLGSIVKGVVLSSANSISGYSYNAGHIFSILGVDGPPNSNRRYLVLNSAARRNANTLVACQDGFPDDPGPYQASLTWVVSSELQLKQFSNKYLAWTID